MHAPGEYSHQNKEGLHLKPVSLSKYFGYKKSFNEMTAKDIADYLGSMHRDETVDPDQKWVNTHNTSSVYFQVLQVESLPSSKSSTEENLT